jgi:hypothetical protein
LLAFLPRKIHKQRPACREMNIVPRAVRSSRAFRLTAKTARVLHCPGKTSRDCVSIVSRALRGVLPGGGEEFFDVRPLKVGNHQA